MAAPGGEKMKENEMSKILHQRSACLGKRKGPVLSGREALWWWRTV